MLVNVLLVEDNESDAFSIKRALEKKPDKKYCVFHAKTMAEAKALLKTDRQFDVVLLDLHLPDTAHKRDTYQTMRRIQKDTPIVILTSFCDHNLAIESLDKGIEDYVLKSRVVRNDVSLNEKIDFAIHRNQFHKKTMKTIDNEKEHLVNMITGSYSA